MERKNIWDTLCAIVSIIIVTTLWEIASIKKLFMILALASPIDVAISLVFHLTSGYVLKDVFNSLLHLACGFAMASILGIGIGAFTGMYENARRLINPIMEVLRPIPPIAWIPIAILMPWGDLEASAFIIFIGAFFPIVTNTYFGFREVEKKYEEVALSLGASKKDLILKVRIPSASPAILTGLKIGLGVGWMCVIAAEMFGRIGLGYRIIMFGYLYDVPSIIAYMLIIGVVGYSMQGVFSILERKILKWRIGLIVGVKS